MDKEDLKRMAQDPNYSGDLLGEVWEIRDGQLARLRNYFDSASLMRPLGLMRDAEPV